MSENYPKNEMDNHVLLMTPGPVSVSPSVLSALSIPICFHRSRAFENLFAKVRDKLAIVFDASPNHDIFLLSGSGTLANESVLSSVFCTEDCVLVLSNGEFGERIIKILACHNIPYKPFRRQWGEPFQLNVVKRHIIDSTVTAVAMVAMETSTGMVNPVHEVGVYCQQCGNSFFVDAVSALGSEAISVKKDYIDFCTSVPNKALGGAPGLGIVCANSESIKQNLIPSSHYLDLFRYKSFAENNQTPTTPAIPTINALDVALDEILSEGIQNRISRYKKLTTLILQELRVFGIEPFIFDTEKRSSAVLTLCFPPTINIADFQNYALEKKVVLWKPHFPNDYDRNIIQVAVMGIIQEKHVKYFLRMTQEFFQENRFP